MDRSPVRAAAESEHRPGAERLPPALRTAGAASWRLLAVGAVVGAVVYVLLLVPLVTLPVVAALLLAPLLSPATRRLRARVPGAVAAGAVLAAALLFLGVLLAAIVPLTASELPSLATNANQGLRAAGGLLGLPPQQASLEGLINENAAVLQQTLLSGVPVFTSVGAGVLLALTVLFFFLSEGERIWGWVVGLFPTQRRATVEAAGRQAWQTLGGYMRGTTAMALIDSVLLAIALLLIGVPLVLPLAVLTFVGGFFPLLGSLLAGALAALVALVSNGLVAAVVVLAVIVALQSLESTLYPRIVRRRVGLHALATLLLLTAGLVLGGALGALLSVPLAAVLYSIAGYLGSERQAQPASG